jgi:hypothetical protein
LADPSLISVELSKLFLDPQNPRFDPVEDEAEAIAALCSTEQLVAIAESIAANGLNPLELTAITEIRGKDGRGIGRYIVREGNRRIAALKLLKDSTKAPTRFRPDFAKLSSSRVPSKLQAMLFDSHESVEPWLRLLHQRDQNPAGRKSWTLIQQARSFGSARNQRALNLTDLAIKESWLSKDQRARTISTVQRWTSNPQIRSYLGIEFEKTTDAVMLKLPQEVAYAALKYFFSQIVERKINTRANRAEMAQWLDGAQKPPVISPSDGKKTGGQNTTAGGGDKSKTGGESKSPGTGSKKPTKPTYDFLPFSQDIEDRLATLGNQKLSVLYHELCTTKIESVQLLCIGWWSFLSTLCSVLQNQQSADFSSFLSHDRLSKIGFSDKSERKNYILALESIAEGGNTTKHATTATMLNQDQLYNDVQTIERVIVRLLDVQNGNYSPKGNWP